MASSTQIDSKSEYFQSQIYKMNNMLEKIADKIEKKKRENEIETSMKEKSA